MRMADSELEDVSQQDESLSGDQAGPPPMNRDRA
jgi:hypothetical protein